MAQLKGTRQRSGSERKGGGRSIMFSGKKALIENFAEELNVLECNSLLRGIL